ncbi:type I restriction-modification system subunit M [Leptospira sp. 2 VSF19]|uniref:site-specific DNA-methyltransferase (adenine-specific) n=1 Tax=Leptospira soteropolitanensis TaxID=2950025 RepID=A0AAW5VH42_9LEPT|nr:class I SAM-dependent DNA methyltransferase [Leptospira soteropolitanensis]MCW7493564.1 type I restriction-modification system subunit M [Leptospira soteropolitanensis]MCW7500905.1 type I restriction-modification system subunit M [Leptospira soteropolitanensis]MCW7523415.1 type I restriction-modification system subunit M [Leptospira soteropolitanensis]MCW7527276.1 type I restriction-modification system subunit M [Leptospira soteropolitanensis]MCW7531133.1 type I restriction-modification sys
MEDKKVTLSQLEQYLSKAAWILKGPVDASDFKVYIFPLLFFKRISDVYDEEYRIALEESGGDQAYALLPEMHRFEIPDGCHWKNIREKTTNVGLAIEKALRGIEKANQEYLYGIFGDAQWSNKNKLTDKLLINLIEHFSMYSLGRENVNPDMLGEAYEYLIKHFADLTNKKAGEFYTPRSVVHLLGLILDPHEGESIYDPACGTGGMLLECVDHLKHNKEDYRTLKLFGQEKNLTSSAIARMNMFLHGIEDFQILRGDTLRSPAFFEADGLKTFDCVIANPPFSLSDWGSENWANDPFGRNIAGVPPQSNGDMAWVQHMVKSMNQNGRMTVVLPHGALFRKGAEGKIRQALLEQDLLEAVIGLGPNIFYGTQLAACVLVFKRKKEKSKKNKVLFIDGSDQVRVGRAQNFLDPTHVDQLFAWYKAFKDVDNYVKVVSFEELKENEFNLNIPLYVEKIIEDSLPAVEEAMKDLKEAWQASLEAEERFKKILEKFIK